MGQWWPGVMTRVVQTAAKYRGIFSPWSRLSHRFMHLQLFEARAYYGLIEPRWEQTVPRRVWRESWPPLISFNACSCGEARHAEKPGIDPDLDLKVLSPIAAKATKYQSCLLFLSRFHRMWLDFFWSFHCGSFPLHLNAELLTIHSTEWHSFCAQFIYQWLQKETWIRQWNEWECALLVQACVSWVNYQSRSMVDQLPSLTKIAGITPRQDRQIGRFLQLLQ